MHKKLIATSLVGLTLFVAACGGSPSASTSPSGPAETTSAATASAPESTEATSPEATVEESTPATETSAAEPSESPAETPAEGADTFEVPADLGVPVAIAAAPPPPSRVPVARVAPELCTTRRQRPVAMLPVAFTVDFLAHWCTTSGRGHRIPNRRPCVHQCAPKSGANPHGGVDGGIRRRVVLGWGAGGRRGPVWVNGTGGTGPRWGGPGWVGVRR